MTRTHSMKRRDGKAIHVTVPESDSGREMEQIAAALRLALDCIHAPHIALEAACPDVVCCQIRAALALAGGV